MSALERKGHAPLLMRPVPPGSVTPPEQRFVRTSLATNSFEEADRLRLQNDRAWTGLPIDAESPCKFIKVADRAGDQFAIARAGQEASGEKISEFSVGGRLDERRACASEKWVPVARFRHLPMSVKLARARPR